MTKSSETPHLDPDLGKAHGRTPDRGRPSGHTPADHADPTRKLSPAEQDLPGDGEPKPTEKARPRDTYRGGA